MPATKSPKKPAGKKKSGHNAHRKPRDHRELTRSDEAIHALGQRIRRVAINTLVPDDRNARLHDERNLAAIEASLSQFGQVEPLVVQKSTRRVIGGNGRLSAMLALGITHVDIVELDLTDEKARALAIVLNRTGELAAWDVDELQKQLEELADTDLADLDLGFTPEQLDALVDGDIETAHGFVPEKLKVEKKTEEPLKAQFLLVVTCKNEKHQAELITKFEAMGLEYSAPSSAGD